MNKVSKLSVLNGHFRMWEMEKERRKYRTQKREVLQAYLMDNKNKKPMKVVGVDLSDLV